MPYTKLPTCCARVNARVVMEGANLARLARQASERAAKGLSTVALVQRIEDAKVAVQKAKDAVVEHEANHAGGGL